MSEPTGREPRSLQRRLVLYLLICAPLVWAVALIVSVDRARHEVNELFDTELIRLARQVQVTLKDSSATGTTAAPALPAPPRPGSPAAGESDVRDLAVAAWDRQGRLMLADREGAELPRLPDRSGFVDEEIDGQSWRVYYLQSVSGEWLVAAGQKTYERDEVVYSLTASQVVPWLLVLPVLLLTMNWAARRALEPLRQLTADLQGRGADDLAPVPGHSAPAELKPLVGAMNGLFERIEALLARERRFTADAAHELRTPLAILRVQWDVVRRAAAGPERDDAEAKFTAGLERMGRLVAQMLALSRLEAGNVPAPKTEVRWPTVVEEAVNECLALAERRRIDLACDWPPDGRHPMPLLGDEHLLVALLRNLLDNAVRYAPPGSTVTLRIGEEQLEVENEGPPLSAEQLARLGERYFRPAGQPESGSGLGISIARRVAELHGLELAFETCAAGQGVRVAVRFAAERR
ncbi:two-component sensor histidine kinase [Variovorax sp. WS11]|uniref:ATP-binding protein n=1 Tax=Variovorax sp. WS11 TaxID=1105204 RepID=UPI000D0CBAE9|nr:ATP-binding protein [Variovorax sp. WS11]NDZ18421.1 two-component sensor histidine kinase [Variovorax sp. WS11]PSL85074.1 two-component sensor histidine kinase [Variovorax sp. WS11]